MKGGFTSFILFSFDFIRSTNKTYLPKSTLYLSVLLALSMVSPLRDPKLEYAYQRLTDKWNEERKVRQFVIHFCMAQTPLYTSEGIPSGKCKDLCRWTNQDKLWFVTQEVVEYYSDKS